MKKNNDIVKKIAYFVLFAVIVFFAVCIFTGCDYEEGYVNGTTADVNQTQAIAANLSSAQPTPKDINYSLERYNLIKRAYWVNGQREKANTLVCPVEKPLGYIVLFTESGSVVNTFCVDGKVTSLNSYLTPDSEYYELSGTNGGHSETWKNKWLADVDGSYGENDNGIFFFTIDGKYIEWTGTYLYSDIPFIVDDPIVKIGGDK